MRKPHITPGFTNKVKQWLTGKYIENSNIASQNIPAGKWVTWKGQVCRSETAITAGDKLSSANLATDEEGTLNGVIFQAGIVTLPSYSTYGNYKYANTTIQLNGMIPNANYVVMATAMGAGIQMPTGVMIMDKTDSSFKIQFTDTETWGSNYFQVAYVVIKL